MIPPCSSKVLCCKETLKRGDTTYANCTLRRQRDETLFGAYSLLPREHEIQKTFTTR